MGTSGQMSTSNQYVKYTITINQNWQDIANNYSNVTVSVRAFRTNTGYETYGSGAVYCRINGGLHSASIVPSQKITNAGIVLFSETHNIPHNADGSKYLDTSAWFSITNVVSSNEQGYGEWLSTIPRTSPVFGGSGNIGGWTTINVHWASTSFRHNLYYGFGNIGRTLIATGIGDRCDWYMPPELASQIPTANSGVGYIECETWSGGTYIGSSSTLFTAYIVDSNPVFSVSNISYKDSNTSIAAITGNNQHIVRNQSNLQATFTSATAKSYASIAKYQITFNGQTGEKTAASTINYGLVDSGNNLNLTIKAIDSRGNATSATIPVTVLDWQLPNSIITANRKNNYEDESYLKVDASVSSVNAKNGLESIKYRYKKTSDSAFSSYTTIQNNTQYTISIDNQYAWDFQFVVTDKFGSTTYNLVVAKGMPILFFDSQKISVGINKFPTNNSSLDIDVLNGKLVLNYDVISMWDDPAIYTIDFNDTYYFTHSGGVFTSNNKGINNSVAYTRLKIDLTNRRNSNVTAKIDYTISSESGYDFGYVTANNTAEFVAYNEVAGRFVYDSGQAATRSSTTTLTKGLVWYLHLGYRKDTSAHSNNDQFIINKITLT